jgi:hypothetical protein
VTTCPASESGERGPTLCVFTTTGSQDATQSLASLFPCQIGVTWTPPPTRERAGRQRAFRLLSDPVMQIGRSGIRRLEPMSGAYASWRAAIAS